MKSIGPLCLEVVRREWPGIAPVETLRRRGLVVIPLPGGRLLVAGWLPL